MSANTSLRGENWPILKDCVTFDRAIFCPDDVKEKIKDYFGSSELPSLALNSCVEFRGVAYSEFEYVVTNTSNINLNLCRIRAVVVHGSQCYVAGNKLIQ